MNKEEIIRLIEERIKSEYRKHATSLPEEWAKIAAHKIFSSLKDQITLEDKNSA